MKIEFRIYCSEHSVLAIQFGFQRKIVFTITLRSADIDNKQYIEASLI